MSQYALGLSLPPVYSADNFFVSDCNRTAWQWVESWPNWQSLLLTGPEGSGKSHLGHIWAMRVGAFIASASELPDMPGNGHWLIEDIEQIPQERTLFHWFNAIREHGGSLLVTSMFTPKLLPFTLPDLTSRLRAIPSAHIDQPDDTMLGQSIRKQFADRQLKVEEDVISYMIPRMERSLTHAAQLVASIDALALAEGKTITIPFVKRLL